MTNDSSTRPLIEMPIISIESGRLIGILFTREPQAYDCFLQWSPLLHADQEMLDRVPSMRYLQ